jgi:outer membrane lipoprotein SlyB
MTKQLTIILLVTAIGFGLFVTGCENEAQTSSMIGALAGAGIGQLAGRDSESTLIGAAVGAGAGYIFGNESDKKRTNAETNANIQALRAEQNSTVVWVTNSNGSMVPVKLSKNGPGYIGPRGELYAKLPSQDQLRTVYGF